MYLRDSYNVRLEIRSRLSWESLIYKIKNVLLTGAIRYNDGSTNGRTLNEEKYLDRSYPLQ